MSIRTLLLVAAAAAVATALAILLIDAPAARALAEVDVKSAPVRGLDFLLEWLDRLTFMLWPRGRLATILIVAGGIAWFWRRPVGHALLLLGITHAISRVGGSYLKPVLGRWRPSEALERGQLDDTFFQDGGISFPSGHIGHYAALAFAVAVLWPRARVPAFAVLGVVILARVIHNAHWISDVTGAIALAALAAAAAAALTAGIAARSRTRTPASSPPAA
jgi:membrane-associated phospholipid phosphatase